MKRSENEKRITDPKGLNRQWRKFLSKSNGSLNLCVHAMERILERFPELQKLTMNEFLEMVRKSEPQNLTVTSVDSSFEVASGKIVFVVGSRQVVGSRDDTLVTLFRNRREKTKKVKIGRVKKSKNRYDRSEAKKEAKKEIKESESA